ncbi:unnamed protein product, partial [Polarella glacialis]
LLRANAPSFISRQPPPGLGAAEDDVLQLKHGQAASPGSTMDPSPWMSPVMGIQEKELVSFNLEDSPSAGFSASPRVTKSGSDQFEHKATESLTKELMAPPGLESELTPEGPPDPPESEFNTPLQGLSTFQSSLASLLDLLKPGVRDRTASDFSSTSTWLPEEEGSTSTASETEELQPPSPASEKEPEAKVELAATEAAVEMKVKKGWAIPGAAEVKVSATSVPPQEEEASHKPGGPSVTYILKNIPKRCTPEVLRELLAEGGCTDGIDFMYLPMDLKMKSNVGQAVLNFQTEAAGTRFSKAFDKVSAKKVFPGSNVTGTCTVCMAPLQGQEANVSSLQRNAMLMSMLADLPVWLPRVFDASGQLLEFPQTV